MPISYSPHIGRPSATCDTTSGGVKIAARTKIARMTYFRLLRSMSGVVSPTRVVNYTTTGSWNATPNGTRKPNRKLTYLSMDSIGVASESPATRKKSTAREYTAK